MQGYPHAGGDAATGALATSRRLPDCFARRIAASAGAGIVMDVIKRLAADMASLRGAWRSLKPTMPIARHPTHTFPMLIEELADTYGGAPALLSDRESFSYQELAGRSNRYARWALAQNLAKGDTVCLLMLNRPEYLAIWLGITRVGGVVALLNTNLAGLALAHCI